MLVRLDRDWTDPTGVLHAAGELVEVDAVTLADLRAAGTLAEEAEARADAVPEYPLWTLEPPEYAQEDTVVVNDDRPGSAGDRKRD